MTADDTGQRTLAPVILKKREDRRIRRGHPWVFSNEVDVAKTPLTALVPGQMVEVQASNGASLGVGYANPATLICVRLLGRGKQLRLDTQLLERRLGQALDLRERLFDAPYYRLVHAEGDALPGLIVDRYGDKLVVQISTAGMEAAREPLLATLHKLLEPAAIVLRNDIASRELEGLPRQVEVVHGALDEHIELEENGLRFEVDANGGQKTGWFFDQRLNRATLRHYASGQQVLDVFCYAGGFGVNAAVAGATEVTCIDSSKGALKMVERNAALNQVAAQVKCMRGDAFDALKQLRTSDSRFDVAVVDPPALIPRRKDREAGQRAYYRLNRDAISLLKSDGFLFSASCSHHLDADQLRDIIYKAARSEGRRVQFLESGRQGPDHPAHPAMAESEYLKLFVVRLLSG